MNNVEEKAPYKTIILKFYLLRAFLLLFFVFVCLIVDFEAQAVG